MSLHPPAPPAVRVEQLSKQYVGLGELIFPKRAARAKRPPAMALRDISFSVECGETVGLLGPNGAGKTTLLKILATLIAPSSGSVHVDDVDVIADPAAARRRIGLVSCDERSFYWRLTGRQNLRFFAALYRVAKVETDRRIDALLATLGLTAAADRPYQGYSSGMKQKLAIARGLLARPSLVLYDEPTRSLDPVSSHNIRNWIMEERVRSSWQTHLIATNQLAEAEQLCDRVLIVSHGEVLAQGTVNELRREWRRADSEVHRITYRHTSRIPPPMPDESAGLLEVAEAGDGVEAGERVVQVTAVRGSAALSVVLARVLRLGGTIVSCDTTQVTLDDIFRAVVAGAPAAPAAPSAPYVECAK